MKFIVYQSFETLGDPDARTFASRILAEARASVMRDQIASMVASWPTPPERNADSGDLLECEAWNEAGKIAGVLYADATGERIAGPEIYGRLAGRFVANMAVKIEEME
ncbi:MAG: hypothetical protein WCG75_00185 [Armatimonadota bacterium]